MGAAHPIHAVTRSFINYWLYLRVRKDYMNSKVPESYPPAYYELFEDLQADMQHWAADGRLESDSVHIEWDPRILHVDRDLYKETAVSYRRRHLNRSMD